LINDRDDEVHENYIAHDNDDQPDDPDEPLHRVHRKSLIPLGISDGHCLVLLETEVTKGGSEGHNEVSEQSCPLIVVLHGRHHHQD